MDEGEAVTDEPTTEEEQPPEETSPAEPESPEEPPAKPQTPPTKTKPSEIEDCVSPTPSGEDLPQGELNKIIQSTLHILEICQKKVDEQKIDSHSLAFMLLRIKESLDAYLTDYMPKLNAYLFHAEQITAGYYAHMVCTLRQYCENVALVESQTNELIEAGAECPIKKADLLNLVKSVCDNYFAAGSSVKSSRLVYKDLNNTLSDRIDIVNKITCPMSSWMMLQDRVNSQLEGIRDQTFKISAYVEFLKQGESKNAPSLDLSPLQKQYKDNKD